MRYIANSEMVHWIGATSVPKTKQPTRMANSESVALPTELEVRIKDFTVFHLLAPRSWGLVAYDNYEPVTS